MLFFFADQSGDAAAEPKSFKSKALTSVIEVSQSVKASGNSARAGEYARAMGDECKEGVGGDGEDGEDAGGKGRDGEDGEDAGGKDQGDREEETVGEHEGEEREGGDEGGMQEAGKGEAKERGRARNGSGKGHRENAPADSPPSGKIIFTPHTTPRHGGARRKRKSSELPSSSDKRRRSEDGAESGKKKSRYRSVKTSALCTFFPPRTMRKIGRRLQLLMIMRDGFSIRRRADERRLNLGMIGLAAHGVLPKEDAQEFVNAMLASFGDQHDQ
jgi:hypothetical protein